MSYRIPFEQITFKPVNDVVPENESSDNPVEFDLVPAGGPDRARLRSIIEASVGLTPSVQWTADIQDAVIHAFDTGATLFQRTVRAIRNLTVQGELAVACGVITVRDGDQPPASVAIRTGTEFAKVCGYMPGMAFHVAMKIAELTGKLEFDPRFFSRPSGSGGPAIASRPATTAGNVPPQNGDAATVGSAETTASSQPAT